MGKTQGGANGTLRLSSWLETMVSANYGNNTLHYALAKGQHVSNTSHWLLMLPDAP